MTTKKQLVEFATALIKEVSKSDKKVSVDFKNYEIYVWFYYEERAEHIFIYSFLTLRESKQRFKKAILKIRG